MNIYDRIINILLEARVEMFIEDRLDEKKLIGKQKKLDVNKSGKLDSEDFKMLRSGKRADEGIVKARNKAMKNAFTDKLRHQEAPPAGRSGKIALSSREGEAASDHEVRMARKTKVPTGASEKRAVGRDNLRKGDTFRSDEAQEEKGMSPEVKGAIRQDRFEKATGISPAKSEDARQKKHRETYGKAAPGRAIKARGRRQVDNP